MRGAIALVFLLAFPLVSAILVDIDVPENIENLHGDEIVLKSIDGKWDQKMWDDLEDRGITPLRLLNPNELLAWNAGNTELNLDKISIHDGIGAEWRGGGLHSDTYNGDVWVVFEPNLPATGVELIIEKFKQIGIEINQDLESYNSIIP